MDLNDLSTLDLLVEQSKEALSSCSSIEEVDKIRVELLGSKGTIKNALKSIKQLPKEKRPEIAQKVNAAAKTLENEVSLAKERVNQIKVEKLIASDWADLSLPGTFSEQGAVHPVSYVEKKCAATLRQMGFQLVEGNEVEEPYYNFDALNIPKHHPARDLQDTFWLENERLLRTHTTAVTARYLEKKHPLPVKIAVAGRVYRNEAIDATHLAMFHQFDGFWIDKGITFSHLKGVTTFLAKSLYGENRRLRFKPKYYPYTEPSVGIDVSCGICDGQGGGCKTCHDAGWVTIMGAGMLHPNVFKEFGYDPDEVSGIAFGWGTTRMATQLFGLSKLRPIYEGNLRLLKSLNGRSPL